MTWAIATMAVQSSPYSAARLSECTSKNTAAYTGLRASTTPSAEASATTQPMSNGMNSESNAISWVAATTPHEPTRVCLRRLLLSAAKYARFP